MNKFSPRFYRQRPIGNYIVDFYCPKTKLVIELDGVQHYEKKNYAYDVKRTEFLQNLGITVIRFDNTDVHYEFDYVCNEIKTVINFLTNEE